MAKPDTIPTVLAYGMREVGGGKWEAFRARVSVTALEPLTPVHHITDKVTKWHDGRVPDPKRTENEPLKTIPGRVLGEVDGKVRETRGEREDLALNRFHEAEHIDRMKVKLAKGRAARRVA